MATAKREKLSNQVDPELLAGMRKIANDDGRQLQAVLEDTFRSYIETRSQKVTPGVMTHVRASMERNRGLLELLAQ